MPTISCYTTLSDLKSSYDKTSTYLDLYDSITEKKIGCIINIVETKIFGNNDSYVLMDNIYTIYDIDSKGQGSFSTKSVLKNNILDLLKPFQNKTGVLDGSFVTLTNKVTVFGKSKQLNSGKLRLDILISYYTDRKEK